MKIVQHFVVQPQDLNHMGSLFGGAACSQADLSGYICATLAYPDAHFVTRHFEPFNFLSPAHLGDILAVTAEITKTGNTSVVISLEAINTKTKQRIYSTRAVFVNAPKGIKNPLTKFNMPDMERTLRSLELHLATNPQVTKCIKAKHHGQDQARKEILIVVCLVGAVCLALYWII